MAIDSAVIQNPLVSGLRFTINISPLACELCASPRYSIAFKVSRVTLDSPVCLYD